MEKEQAIQSESNYPIKEEPHFDEEWTVLTARPVVPLGQVESRKSTNRIKLATAFVIAMILGAWVALMAVHFERSGALDQTAAKEETAPVQTQVTQDPSAAEETKQSSKDSDERENPVTSPDDQPGPDIASKSEVAVPETSKNSRRRSDTAVAKDLPARVSAETAAASVEMTNDRAGNYPADRPRLVDQWEEHRARRVRRDRREQAYRHQRDLRRIDEIFEGTRP